MRKYFRTPKLDSENVVSFTCSNSALPSVLKILEELEVLSSIGSSRDIIVDWGKDKEHIIFFDGDGKDRVNNVSVNGLTLDEWEKEWTRLEEIDRKS